MNQTPKIIAKTGGRIPTANTFVVNPINSWDWDEEKTKPKKETKFTFIVNEDNPVELEKLWESIVYILESYGYNIIGSYTPGIVEEAGNGQPDKSK